jgi:hypothetical protein
MEVSEAAFRLPFSVFRLLDAVCLWSQPSEDRVQEEHPFPRADQAPRRSWLHMAEDSVPRQPPIHEERFRFEASSREALTLHSASEKVRSMCIIRWS